MARELGVGGGRFGLVAAGALDRALQIVGHEQRRHASHEFEEPHVGADPIGQALGPGRLRIGVVRGPQHADKDLGGADLARGGVDHRYRLAGVVEE
jgi:hypothetical protein